MTRPAVLDLHRERSAELERITEEAYEGIRGYCAGGLDILMKIQTLMEMSLSSETRVELYTGQLSGVEVGFSGSLREVYGIGFDQKGTPVCLVDFQLGDCNQYPMSTRASRTVALGAGALLGEPDTDCVIENPPGKESPVFIPINPLYTRDAELQMEKQVPILSQDSRTDLDVFVNDFLDRLIKEVRGNEEMSVDFDSISLLLAAMKQSYFFQDMVLSMYLQKCKPQEMAVRISPLLIKFLQTRGDESQDIALAAILREEETDLVNGVEDLRFVFKRGREQLESVVS
jgi:hypothetical protein